MGAVGSRYLTGLLALATVPIGLALSAAAQLAGPVLLLIGMLYLSSRGGCRVPERQVGSSLLYARGLIRVSMVSTARGPG